MFEYNIDLKTGVTSKELQDLQKALNTTTGAALLPSYLSRRITNQVRQKAILVNAIYREPFPGAIYNWPILSASPNTGLTYAIDGAIPTNDITLGDGSQKVSQFGVYGQVSYSEIAGTQNFVDVFQLAINERIKELLRSQENYIFNGDSNVSGSGLIANLTASSTYTTAASAGLTALLMNSAVAKQEVVYGYDSSSMVWVVGYDVLEYIMQAGWNKTGFRNVTPGSQQIGFNLGPQDTLKVGKVPVISSFAAPLGSLFLLSLDPADLLIFEQQPLKITAVAELANLDARQFKMTQYLGLAVRNPLAHVYMPGAGLSTPANF
jgi:HK97 family phage major capsid protein